MKNQMVSYFKALGAPSTEFCDKHFEFRQNGRQEALDVFSILSAEQAFDIGPDARIFRFASSNSIQFSRAQQIGQSLWVLVPADQSKLVDAWRTNFSLAFRQLHSALDTRKRFAAPTAICMHGLRGFSDSNFGMETVSSERSSRAGRLSDHARCRVPGARSGYDGLSIRFSVGGLAVAEHKRSPRRVPPRNDAPETEGCEMNEFVVIRPPDPGYSPFQFLRDRRLP
jgi:hypothetical protein